MRIKRRKYNFYPRSPCGERRQLHRQQQAGSHISIHALLAESDAVFIDADFSAIISIHALLAESDLLAIHICQIAPYFYPRSPCGERPCINTAFFIINAFLSTLSVRRATHK